MKVKEGNGAKKSVNPRPSEKDEKITEPLSTMSEISIATEGVATKERDREEKTYPKSCLEELKETENFRDSAIIHIFEGEVKTRRGRDNAGGYHYECIEDSAGTIIAGTEQDLNDLGVYKAKVEVSGIAKTANEGYSTFFPKSLSPQDVVDSINQAYGSKVFKTGNEYYGYANNGVKITMYLDTEGKIISAFPAQ